MKTKVIEHRIYRVENDGLRLDLQRQPGDVMEQLNNAGIKSSNTADGAVLVNGKSLDAVLAALGFDREPFKVEAQERSILVTETID